MRAPKLPTLVSVALVLVLFAPQVLLAQYAISTVAGGGPNNLTALSASIGYPGSVALSGGNTYIADRYSNHIFKVDASNNLTVVAGNGTSGYSGDGGPATSAALNGPEGVFVDGSGNIFIADTENSVIREVSVSTGNISTVATDLNDPVGVFVDAAGDIFIADADNAVIREVVAGTVQIVAGNGTICADPTTPCGDGGPATSAQLGAPEGVFVDATGNIFIADTDDSRIRAVNTGTAQITIAGVTIPAGYIQTVAGAYYDSQGATACQDTGDNGPALSAYLCSPTAVYVDPSEDIFIADWGNSAIREIAAPGANIATVAGTLGKFGYSPNGTLATSADLNYPSNMVVDSSGDIFIADTDNFVIREVTASTGDIQTIIGNNTLAYSGDGGLAVNAELNAPGAVSADGLGDVFIADADNNLIRVANTGTTANTVAGVVIQSGDIQTVAGSYYVPVGLAPCDYSGDNGPPTSAQLCAPGGVFVDGSGNIFIVDTQNNRIRVVNTGTGALTFWGITVPPGDIATVAGNGTFCPDSATACGDGNAATSAELAAPYGVFVDSAENIFIADTSDFVIREVAASSGTITTVAGNYTQCIQTAPPSCGDGAAATGAQLNFPRGVAVDLSENIYIADTFDNSIRVVNPSATQTVTVAGVTIPPGDIATVAGNGTVCTQPADPKCGDGGAATSAELYNPYGVFVDLSGDIFIADTENAAIREVVAATGFIQTVAGILQTPGFSGDGEQATSAELHTPLGLVGNSAGSLFVVDTDNSRIRELLQSIFVTVTPNPVNVVVNALQQFTATVTGTSNTAVTWQVNGVVGGNLSTTGSISTTGLFQAPQTVPTPATVTITAISNADNTTSASAQATIVNSSTTVIVAVSPTGTSQVYTSTTQQPSTQQFTATVTGTTNTAVYWYVEGAQGGSATVGTISTSGLYTAPTAVPSPATVVIEAESQADSTAIGTASVMIVTAPSAAQPPPQTTSPGGTATYSLSLNANTGVPGQPITLSCLQSSLPPSAACSFSPTAITPGASAVPFSLTITVPTSSASLEKPNGMQPQLFFAFVPLAGILFAGFGTRNKQRRWLWLAGLCVFLILLNACGGSSSPGSTGPQTYNVKVQGTTSAQPKPVTITIASLTVQ